MLKTKTGREIVKVHFVSRNGLVDCTDSQGYRLIVDYQSILSDNPKTVFSEINNMFLSETAKGEK